MTGFLSTYLLQILSEKCSCQRYVTNIVGAFLVLHTGRNGLKKSGDMKNLGGILKEGFGFVQKLV